MPFVHAGDITQHYSIDADRDGPTLVFANSLGTDLRIWDLVAAELGPRYRRLRYDQRGHGLTDGTPAPYTIRRLAEDLAALLDALSVQKAVVCGLSVGGMIALQLARSHPARVGALVLCDTAATIGTEEVWNARIAAVEAVGLESIAAAVMERWFTATFREKEPATVEGHRNMLERTTPAGYIGTCAAIRDADLAAHLGTLRVPTLALCGDQDVATPAERVRSMAEAIPGARFAVIPGAGHLPCVEQPQALAREVARFVETEVAGG